MFAAECLRDQGDLHHVFVDVEDDVAARGVVADGYQADPFDQDHFRRVTVLIYIRFDLFFGRFQQRFLAIAVEIEVFRFAIYDRVRRERSGYLGVLGRRREEVFGQFVIAYFQRFETLLAEHHPDGGQHFLSAFAYQNVSFGQFRAGRLFDRSEHFFVDGFHLFGRIRSDEDAVVLQ